MAFEEWWDEVATSDPWVRLLCKDAWEAAWYKGVAEGYKEGVKDSKLCKWCLEELAQEQES